MKQAEAEARNVSAEAAEAARAFPAPPKGLSDAVPLQPTCGSILVVDIIHQEGLFRFSKSLAKKKEAAARVLGVTRSPWVPLGSLQAELRFFQQLPRLDSGDPVLASALKVQPEDVSESIRVSAVLGFNPMLSHAECKFISKCIYIFFLLPARSYCAPLFTSAQWPLHPGSARRD